MVQQQAAERAAWAASVRQATGQRVTTGYVFRTLGALASISCKVLCSGAGKEWSSGYWLVTMDKQLPFTDSGV
jgi:hypothetical protein